MCTQRCVCVCFRCVGVFGGTWHLCLCYFICISLCVPSSVRCLKSCRTIWCWRQPTSPPSATLVPFVTDVSTPCRRLRNVLLPIAKDTVAMGSNSQVMYLKGFIIRAMSHTRDESVTDQPCARWRCSTCSGVRVKVKGGWGVLR